MNKKEYAKQYYLDHKEKFLEQSRKQYKNNPERRKKVLEYERQRRKRMTLEEKREEKARCKYGENAVIALRNANHKCIKCEKSYRLAVHHIDCNEENNALENLAILCQSCHAKVQTYIPVPRELRVEWFKEWMVNEIIQFKFF